MLPNSKDSSSYRLKLLTEKNCQQIIRSWCLTHTTYFLYQFKLKCQSYLTVVLYENFNDDITELYVHDGRHGLLLWSQQGGAETHGEVADCHQVLVAMRRHAGTQTQLLKE